MLPSYQTKSNLPKSKQKVCQLPAATAKHFHIPILLELCGVVRATTGSKGGEDEGRAITHSIFDNHTQIFSGEVKKETTSIHFFEIKNQSMVMNSSIVFRQYCQLTKWFSAMRLWFVAYTFSACTVSENACNVTEDQLCKTPLHLEHPWSPQRTGINHSTILFFTSLC